MTIRRAVPGEEAVLCALSVEAIHVSAAEHYTPAQLKAWASRRNVERHRHMIERTLVLVAEDRDGRAAGFVNLVSSGREVDQLYVQPAAQGHGVGSSLLAAVRREAEIRGSAALDARASRRAVRVFERCGFQRVGIELVELDGESLERVVMRLDLLAPRGAPQSSSDYGETRAG